MQAPAKQKDAHFNEADAYEECLFLYRGVPFRNSPTSCSGDYNGFFLCKNGNRFVAAFMLGMKEYFGNVDHLRATVSEVPVPDADYESSIWLFKVLFQVVRAI